MLEFFTWVYIVLLVLGVVINIVLLMDSDDSTALERGGYISRIAIMSGGVALMFCWLY